MMAVICFLPPAACSRRTLSAHAKSCRAIRQLSAYIWVPPLENPQDLANFTFVRHPWQGKSVCICVKLLSFHPGRATIPFQRVKTQPSPPDRGTHATNEISRAPAYHSPSPPNSFDCSLSPAGGRND